MEWNNEAIFRLIDAYRENPVLWDPLDKNYKILHRKNEAWETIANLFKVDVFEIKKKMNSLLASYRRERQKMIVKQLGGSGEENYHPSWFAFNNLSFLFGKYRPRKRLNTNLLEVMKEEDDEKESFAVDSELESEDRDETMATSAATVAEDNYDLSPQDTVWKGNKKIKKPVIKRKLFQEDCHINEVYEVLRSGPHLRDECSTYGEHVANKLRKLDDRNRAIAQHNINNILFEAEMKTFFPEATSQPIPNVPFFASSSHQASSQSSSSSSHSNPKSPPVVIKAELSPHLHFENV